MIKITVLIRSRSPRERYWHGTKLTKPTIHFQAAKIPALYI